MGPPAPQVSSTRLIKVVKKPVGSQHSFSNLDGARASIDSADRLSISSERPEEVEADEEFEKIWDGLTAKWTKELDEKIKKEEKEEENVTTDPTDPMPTLGSSRNSADPEVTTEPTDEDRCLRPLQRARERRAARLHKESDAHAVTNFDPHDSAAERSSASCNLEQDRPQLQCCGCNKILSDSDLSSVDDRYQTLKRAGPSGLVSAESEDAHACAACRN